VWVDEGVERESRLSRSAPHNQAVPLRRALRRKADRANTRPVTRWNGPGGGSPGLLRPTPMIVDSPKPLWQALQGCPAITSTLPDAAAKE